MAAFGTVASVISAGDKIYSSGGTPRKNMIGGKAMSENKRFTRDDIKPGMLVEWRCGGYALAFPDADGNIQFFCRGGSCSPSSTKLMTEDMKCIYGNAGAWDLVAVYGLLKEGSFPVFDPEFRDTLWEERNGGGNG